jgi:anti-sigma-K factor RskA
VSNCDQFREMYELYALGALEPVERAEFEAHLATDCAECAKGVAEARWVVSQLAYTAADAAPSDMLKGRLMQSIRAEARSAAVTGVRSVSGTGTPAWLSAGIAALLLITLYSAWSAHHTKEDLRAANERAAQMQSERADAQQKLDAMEKEMATVRRENAIWTDPAAVKITLMPQKIQALQLVAMCGEQGIVLTGKQVPMPSGNRVLQLWVIPKEPGAKPMPSMTMRPDASGKLILVVTNPPKEVGDIKALAITEEPEGGSAQPTSAIRWVGVKT